MTVTLTDGSAARKKYATELPITPPPTITTFALTLSLRKSTLRRPRAEALITPLATPLRTPLSTPLSEPRKTAALSRY
jgi:hypothetical protein